MDEVLRRRLVGLFTLALVAFLLSWLLPRPGLERLQSQAERVVTMDLTRADSLPEERSASDVPIAESEPAATAEPATTAPPPSEPAPAPDAAAPAAALAGTSSAAAPEPIAEPEPETVPAPAPPPESKPEPPSPAPKPEPKAESKPESKPVPKPAPKPELKPNPTPAAPKPAPAAGSVQVQAGAYSHLDKAEGVRGQAAAQGVSCTIAPAETAKGTLYRVRCGPYADRAKADTAVAKLKAAGIAAQVVSAGR
jgi:DedD protein